LIALVTVGACIAVLTFALLLIAEHDTESETDASEGWFLPTHATDMSEQEALAMWSGRPVTEAGAPRRPDVDPR
jgi:hypothetical protein